MNNPLIEITKAPRNANKCNLGVFLRLLLKQEKLAKNSKSFLRLFLSVFRAFLFLTIETISSYLKLNLRASVCQQSLFISKTVQHNHFVD